MLFQNAEADFIIIIIIIGYLISCSGCYMIAVISSVRRVITNDQRLTG